MPGGRWVGGGGGSGERGVSESRKIMKKLIHSELILLNVIFKRNPFLTPSFIYEKRIHMLERA